VIRALGLTHGLRLVHLSLGINSQAAGLKPADAGYNRLEPVWGFFQAQVSICAGGVPVIRAWGLTHGLRLVHLSLGMNSQAAELKPAEAGFNRLEPVWVFPRRRF
jgi:hypothetical protein